jgi:uncharacterized protein YcaQ
VRLVSPEEARRIAIRAQLLDGSATNVLETVRRLGSLQLDPIATVAPAQHLVLWSRLGSYDTAELDRLLWEDRSLFEFNAYVYPIETLPLVRARMRRWRRSTHYAHERWVRTFLAENPGFRRYVLREIEQRGPLLSRELEDRAAGAWRDHRWWGPRRVGLLLLSLHLYGELAVAGRQGGQRLWDLAERWYPKTETIAAKEAERRLAEQRFRALGVRLGRKGWEAHDEVDDGPVPDRAVVLSPFDRLVQDRARAEALYGFFYRLEMFVPASKREYGYYVLPILHRDRLIGRVEPVFDRKTRVLEIKGAWMEAGAPADAGQEIGASLRGLADWLGATEIRGGKRLPRAWAAGLRAGLRG